MAISGVSGTVGGYGAAFLTAEQQERFASVKTKLCGHKAVDVVDLEKNVMHSIVAAMERLKWTKMATLSEVSYPDLVKAFYVCLKSEEDGSLTSMVKGTQILISYSVLESLFGVSTYGHSGVHTVDVQAKGLGIVGPEFKLKDGKIDINQLNAFNRLLHFIVCQILVPRSAIFSTCTKADSDLMFWAIQNQSINMAEVIIERMKVTNAQVWDKKSKLNVSLPYAYWLTKIFQHFGVNLNMAVSEKMGQAIRIENIPQEFIEPVEQIAEVATPTSVVGSILRSVLDSITSTQGEPERVAEEVGSKAVASGHIEDVVMEDAPSQGEQRLESEVVAASHHEDVLMEDAPIEVEHSVNLETSQGEHTGSVPIDNQFQERIVESASDEEANVDNVEPIARAINKGKEVAYEIPLLTRKPHKRLKRKQLKINLKPLIDRMDEQGKILCSVQSNIASIFLSQSTSAKEMGMVRNAVRWVRSELISIKESVVALIDLVRAQVIHAPPAPSTAEHVGSQGPSGPKIVEEVAASGSAEAVESGPAEVLSGPPGPVESEAVPIRAEEQAVAPEPLASSPLPTPAPPSPPSSSKAPPAPPTFKQPISSPTPFPSQSSSSPVSSTPIPPPPPSFEVPPASSSAGASSSSPSSFEPSDVPPSTTHSFLHPPTPSFITIIPECAQIDALFLRDINDEFEVAILRSIIKLADLNASQAKIIKPPVSAGDFLDMNSIHLVRNPFAISVERYKVVKRRPAVAGCVSVLEGDCTLG
ncbi:hypothetical protein Taro_053555 [Colocasia esculenta]|uniref:Putative plant transposon protein domain-containing protein n=1 Tax=Colocasia esculenta TaxID=4460 RepID=A0A843XMY4_COLES|nr:hypothetical protein [Colocasia esculenta]